MRNNNSLVFLLLFGALFFIVSCDESNRRMMMEKRLAEIEMKFEKGEDISQDTSVFVVQHYFSNQDDAEMKALSSLYSGCAYWQRGDYDSAAVAIDEAFSIAETSGDDALVDKVKQTVSTLYTDSASRVAVLADFRNSNQLNGHDFTVLERNYGAMGRLFEMAGEIDSALYYYNKCAVLQNEYNHALIRKQRWVIVLSLSLLAALSAVLAVVMNLSKKRKKMAELNEEIIALQTEYEAVSETTKNNMFQKAELIFKVFQLGETKEKNVATYQKLKGFVCGKEAGTAYDAIFSEYQKTYPDVVEGIRNKFPNLADWEFRICILSMMPFSVQEVSDILKVRPDTVGKGRTNIRKKIGMTEARGKIADFVLLKITE